MKIEVGKRYLMKCGAISGVIKRRTNGEGWTDGGTWWFADGNYYRNSTHNLDIVSEYVLPPVLPCVLRAGGKYVLDNGEVVTLERSSCMRVGFLNYLPFQTATSKPTQAFFAADGSGFDADKGHLLRITGEYVEPPPTPIERLELWHKRYSEFCDKCKAIGFNEDVGDGLGTIIADLKAEASNG